ncbi:MAG: cytochrome c family protein [Proteobacteria bacterium]|nr:cytochrome c family protein [Pseudomonadota bacterium]MBI3499496.1 cytochrome c family protein [Pseudomonadota bacterium]
MIWSAVRAAIRSPAFASLGVLLALLGLLPIRPALADGDTAAGRKAFSQCIACHRAEEGKNLIGPSLFGVYGRPAASVQDFSYSPAMKNSKITWDDASLDKYLENPMAVVRGGRMAFPGVKNATQRADVIAYLKTLKK